MKLDRRAVTTFKHTTHLVLDTTVNESLREAG